MVTSQPLAASLSYQANDWTYQRCIQIGRRAFG